jgi:hypothetical protein
MRARPRQRRKCSQCENPAVFMTPDGLVCQTHHTLGADGGEAWIPLSLNSPTAHPPRSRGRPGRS